VTDTVQTLQRLLLALLWPTQPSKVVPFVNAIITAMYNNPNFVSPTPASAVLQADLTTFIKALSACETKAVGTLEARVLAELKLRTDVQHLMDFAQAAIDANPAQAVAMAATSGFQQKKAGKRVKAEVALKWGAVSGSVEMILRALGQHVTYFFQVSTDQKNWSSLTPTHRANITATGLTPGVTYYFRFQTLKTPVGLSDWSQTYAILVK
jgi:hypothetical protein